MAWCEENGVDNIFGLAGNLALHVLAYEVADDVRVRCAKAGADRMRRFTDFAYAAGSWGRERRVSPGWRRVRAASMPAISSLRSKAIPAISTKTSTAPAARPRT